MLYRIHSAIGTNAGIRYEKGSVSSLAGISLNSINVLLSKQVITEVMAPPLFVLPGWQERAKVFTQAGIVDVIQFIDSDLIELSSRLKYTVKELEVMVLEVMQFIS